MALSDAFIERYRTSDPAKYAKLKAGQATDLQTARPMNELSGNQLMTLMQQNPAGGTYMGTSWGNGASGSNASGSAIGGGIGTIGGGGPTGGVNYQNLINQWQGKMDEANAANTKRGTEIDYDYKKLYSDTINKLQGMGDTQKAKTAQQFREGAESAKVDMTQRGLGNASGALVSADLGANRENAVAQNAIDESVRGQQAGVMQNIEGNRLGFKERINEIGPDYGQMLNLVNAAGRGQGGLDAYGSNLASATSSNAGGSWNAPIFGGNPVTGVPSQNPLNAKLDSQSVFGSYTKRPNQAKPYQYTTSGDPSFYANWAKGQPSTTNSFISTPEAIDAWRKKQDPMSVWQG